MSTPDPDEFVEFLSLLTEQAPDGYRPWLFRCREGSKAPATKYGSWKEEQARLSRHEAIEWMESGGNVGIAGRPDDPLINVDIDDEDETTIDDLKPTLIARSRSRTGVHAWYFEAPGAEIPNIPTDEAGEVRANWQYVVAPGSYVETDPETVPADERDAAGYYTVERADPVTSIRLDELPAVFRDRDEPDPEQQEILTPDEGEFEPAGGDGERSGLFNISARDVVQKEGGSTDPGDRWSALFHSSDTGENMSVSSKGHLHCWRHEVTHNGLQALCVLSGYTGGCADVGTGHRHSGAGSSCLHREDGAHIWHAWKYAKANGYLPEDDPVPYAALKHLCRERELCPVSEIPDAYDPDDEDGRLPAYAYDLAISSIENHDDLEPGRDKTDEFGDRDYGFSQADSEPPTPVAPDPDSEAGTEAEAETETDGGATTATGGSDPPTGTPDAGREWSLAPTDICELAARDPLTPADYDEDNGGFDFYPRDLRNSELAAYVWDLANRTDNDDVLARQHGPLLSYKPERCIWTDDDSQRVREITKTALGSAFSAGVINEVEENIRADPSRVKTPDEMGAPEATIMTLGGLLDLRDRSTRPGRRDDLAVANLPHEPEFTAECPRWEQFLSESIETEAERLKFQEYCGYTLWRHEQHIGKAMMLVGPTDSGKSTALKVLRHILGEKNVASESLQNLVDTRWGRAQLVGNIANIREEVTPSGLHGVEMFKELTGGGGVVDAEFKGEQKFDFEVTQKFIFATNEVPSVEDADEAFYNRLLFVRFPNTVPPEEQNSDLDDELKREAVGILNWMLDGLDRLLEQGGFSHERPTNDKKELCDAFGGVLDRFVHNCLIVTGHEDDIVDKSDLHDLAQRYADDLDKEPDWNKQSSFTKEIAKERGIGQAQRRLDGDRPRVMTGVRVKPEIVHQYGMDIAAKCTDADDPDPTSLNHYRDEDMRPGYDIRKEKQVIPLILKTLREADDQRLEREALYDQLAEEGIAEETAKAKVKKAKRRGDIHEPETDVLRPV